MFHSFNILWGTNKLTELPSLHCTDISDMEIQRPLIYKIVKCSGDEGWQAFGATMSIWSVIFPKVVSVKIVLSTCVCQRISSCSVFGQSYCAVWYFCQLVIKQDLQEEFKQQSFITISGFPPYLENLKTLNFVIFFSRPEKYLEFAQNVVNPGILTQNLEKTWTLQILCFKLHFSRSHL